MFGSEDCETKNTKIGKSTKGSYLEHSLLEAECINEFGQILETIQLPCIGKFDHPEVSSDYFINGI